MKRHFLHWHIHNWGAAVENARPPYVLDFMAGVHNSERDDDRSRLLMDVIP